MDKTQNKTLLDVVSELPLCDRQNDFGKQFFLAASSIQEWIDKERDNWEQDLLTTIPREKIGLYFLGKTKDLLDEFHDYVPYTIEDWKQMEQGEDLYYCIAMEWYMQAILMLLNHYDIEEDENQKKMFEYCWFIFDDLLDDEPQTPPAEEQQTPQIEEMPKPTKGRGRPVLPLKSKMLNDSDGKNWQKLHELMDGKKRKDAVLIIFAFCKKGWMIRPSYKQVINEFGNIVCKSMYDEYTKVDIQTTDGKTVEISKFSDEEIASVMNALQ